MVYILVWPGTKRVLSTCTHAHNQTLTPVFVHTYTQPNSHTRIRTLLVAVDPTIRQFQVCANALARGSEILFMIIGTSILVYIYAHTHYW